MTRAVLYLRLSKEDLNKEEESASIINQRLLLTDFAIEKGFTITDTYTDDDFSGLYEDRPEFDRLIKDAKLGKFDVVIAKSQSRFTRNMEHMEKYLHHVFPLIGVRFIGVVDGVDTNIQENKKARQIYGLTNEWYSEDLSANIKSVFRQKMKAGQYLGAFAPYGYSKDPADKHRFIIDEYAAGVVREIFSLFQQGYSVKAICRHLEDELIPNPTVYKQQSGLTYANVKADEFSTKYRFWSDTTVKRILSNRTYIGMLEQGKYEKLSYKDKKVTGKPIEEWIVVKNHHDPIIDPETFYRIQKLRSSRRVASGGSHNKVHLFAGKLKCAACHSTMIKSAPVRGDKNDYYFRCQLANKSRKVQCSPHTIRYSVIADAVRLAISEMADALLQEKELQQSIGSLLSASGNSKLIANKKKQLTECEKALEISSGSMKLMYEDKINGTISEELFSHMLKKAEYDMITGREKIQKLKEELAALSDQEKIRKDLKETIRKYCDYSILTHEMVADFVDYILIGEKKPDQEQEITIYWNF